MATGKHTILLVDDEVAITRALTRLLRREGYLPHAASGGEEGLALLRDAEEPVSLIISDQRMPGMNGYEFFEQAKIIAPHAYRILLTGYSDLDSVALAVNRGEIHRYLTKPWNDNDLLGQVRQGLEQIALERENRRLMGLIAVRTKDLEQVNKDLETKVADRTREILKANEALKLVVARLEKSLKDTVRLISSLVETLNPKLGRCMRETGALAAHIARELGLSAETVERIEMAGLLHDIGLLGLPDEIALSEEEFLRGDALQSFMQHPVLAATAFEAMARLDGVSELILHHHEYVNGEGFPAGIKGSAIPEGSRVIAVASAYCRIVYGWTHETNRILFLARKYLGKGMVENICLDDPETLLQTIAEKYLLKWAHQKYDSTMISALLQVRGYLGDSDARVLRLAPYDELSVGMTLEKDLKLKDGRLLMLRGTVLKDTSIAAIRQFGDRGLIHRKLPIGMSESGISES